MLISFTAITTTGRPCYWRNVPPGKDPGFVSTKQYPLLRDVTRRNKRDPRPTARCDNSPMSLQKLEQLRKRLEEDSPTCLLLFHLEGHLDEMEGTENEVEEIHNNDHLADATVQCSRLRWKLNRDCLGKDRPFEVPNTRNQADDEEWQRQRSFLSTAYDVKTFLGLTSGKAKKNYLRKKVWHRDRYVSKAMKEGKEMEATGRKAYEDLLRTYYSSFKILETGLSRNPKYPQLGCSPDGLIKWPEGLREQEDLMLLEIKWYTKEHVDPAKFEEQLTEDERKRFYLLRLPNGELDLKRNHTYYYPIQMALDIVELEWCHLYVFSASGYAVVPIKYDPTFWNEKRGRTIKRHRELILPEHIFKRTLRHRQTIELMYPEFHEDANDDYFLEDKD